MGLDVTDIKPRIGSAVKADPQDLTAGRFAADLRALLIERGVLVFRDLPITIDEQRAFRCLVDTRDQIYQRGLAATGWANDRETGTRGQIARFPGQTVKGALDGRD